MRRVLILGGTGVFGSRLARHLVRHPGGLAPLEVVVTSRDPRRAERMAASLGPGMRGVAAEARDLRRTLAAERPWAVVDCSGPFQGAGHGTARAILDAGAHAVDLADARDYLAGHGALDATARLRGVAALAGASSTPALSGAVARRLVGGWSRVEAIEFAIVPSGRSDVGRAVLEAVLSYAGRPVPVWRDGARAEVPGWLDWRDLEIAGLGRRRVAPVETFDAERLGPLLRAGRLTFRAGLDSGMERLGLGAVALLRQRGLVPDPRPLAGPLRRMRRLTRLTGGDAGGMVASATGADAQGRPCAARWVLVARRGDGPQVPTLPAAAALRALARGTVPPGARLADEVVDLAAIEAEAAPYAIETALARSVDRPRATDATAEATVPATAPPRPA